MKQRGDFSKWAVKYCLRIMTFTLVWAAAIATVALALDRAYNISDILIFASGFFGGELCLLCLKRIFAKERESDGQPDPDPECPDSADFSGDFSISNSVSQAEDDNGGLADP